MAGGLILYGALPDHVYHLLIAALGGVKIKSITDRLIADKSDKTSPYYVAWKLYHKYGANPGDE